MKNDPMVNGNGADADRQLDELVETFSKTLPKEFTVGTIGNSSTQGKKRYPDLHFRADDQTPGLYFADLDPRTLPANGHANGVEIVRDQEDEERK
jgi:hypothetical protein